MAEENKKQWYVVNTYAGHENRVKENLLRRVESMGLQDYLFRVIVAEEKEIEYKNGKEVEKTTNLFSGYLFVEMIMTDEDSQTAVVLTILFGRETPTEIGYGELEKVEL